MATLAFLMVWAGYSVFTYGVATVRGCNVTWSEIALPKGSFGLNKNGYTGCSPDSGSGATAGAGGGAGATSGYVLSQLQSSTASQLGISEAQRQADIAYLKAHPNLKLAQ